MRVMLTFVTPAGVSISVIFLPIPGGFLSPDMGGGGGGVPLTPDGGGGGGGGLFIPEKSSKLDIGLSQQIHKYESGFGHIGHQLGRQR